jgi:hypothetical protein
MSISKCILMYRKTLPECERETSKDSPPSCAIKLFLVEIAGGFITMT